MTTSTSNKSREIAGQSIFLSATSSGTPLPTSQGLPIDFATLKPRILDISHTAIQKVVTDTVEAFEKRAKAFHENIQNPLFKAKNWLEEITELENLVLHGEAATKATGGDIHAIRRAQAILNDLKTACHTCKAQWLPPSKPMVEVAYWQTHRLRMEQQLLLSAPLQESFNTALAKVAAKARSDHKLSKGVFICYAKPDEKESELHWVVPFLENLRSHLQTAGFSQTKLDTKDKTVGETKHTYLKDIETNDFVLLIGTPTLRERHEAEERELLTALEYINQKIENDKAQGQTRVFPLLIYGSKKSSFPTMYGPYEHLDFSHASSKSYIQHLSQLIAHLYDTQEETFQPFWEEFLTAAEKMTAGARLLLSTGLTADYVVSKLKLEQERRYVDDKRRAAAGMSLLGLEGASDFKETKRLSLAAGDTWHLPQPNDHYFTGRVAELKKLQETFATKQEAKSKTMVLNAVSPVGAVSGLGGVGKTQLAIYHIHHEQSYALRIWFQAETGTTLHKDYLEFAREYILPLEEKASKHEVIKAVKRYLASQSNWLAVYDNAGSYQELKEFLPTELKNGHLIITTRRTEWHDKGQQLEVGVFSKAEAIAYIKKLLQRDKTPYSQNEESALTELVRELGYLPLALAQAGAYIKKRNKTIENYLAMYRSQTAAMLADKILPVDSNVQPVATTWNISLKAIEEDESAEIKETGEPKLSLRVLQAMSYLHSDHIPFDLLARWLHTAQFVKDESVIERLLDKALGYLSAYSMIQNHIDSKTVSVHRLVQEVVRFQLQQAKSTISAVMPLESKGDAKSTKSAEQISHSFLLKTLTDSSLEEFNLDTQVLVDEKRKKVLLPHLQALVKHYDSSSSIAAEKFASFGDLLSCIGDIQLYLLADPKQAKAYYEKALKIQQKYYGSDDHPKIITTMGNLSSAYGDLGEDKIKMPLTERALKAAKKIYGPKHPRVAIILGNLATTHCAMGDGKTARLLLEQALEIEQDHYGLNHWQSAKTLLNLACAYRLLGEQEKMISLLRLALDIKQKHYGSEHREVASALNNLALVYVDRRENLEDAKLIIERALKIEREHYGSSHWHLGKTLNTLGAIHCILQDAESAKPLLEQALEIQTIHYGANHWELATTLENLAHACRGLGELEKHKTLLDQALKIKEAHYGSNDPQVARTLENLAQAYDDLKEVSTSKILLEQALEINKAHYGPDHPEVATTLFNLASFGEKLKDITTALKYIQRAYRIFSTYKHPHTREAAALLQRLQYQQQLELKQLPEVKPHVTEHKGTATTTKGVAEELKFRRTASATLAVRDGGVAGSPQLAGIAVGSAAKVGVRIASIAVTVVATDTTESKKEEKKATMPAEFTSTEEKRAVADNHDGVQMLKAKRFPEAEKCFRRTLVYWQTQQTKTNELQMAHFNLGSALLERGKAEDLIDKLIESEIHLLKASNLQDKGGKKVPKYEARVIDCRNEISQRKAALPASAKHSLV